MVEAGVTAVSEAMEDPSFSWTHRYPTSLPYKQPPSSRASSVFATNDYPPVSDFAPSEFSEDVDRDIPDIDSDPTSDSAPGQSSGVFSDSEEEEGGGGEDDEVNEAGYGYRRTFFSTSSERGRWKTDPIPFKPAISLLQTRKSAPTLSRVATPTQLNTRPISEPAPSTNSLKASFVPPEISESQKDRSPCTIAADVDSSMPSESIDALVDQPLEDEATSPQTLPSLTSDRDGSTDADLELEENEQEIIMPSSPLPPSSPPQSPTSRSVSIMSPFSSPLSFIYDRSSSPLSEVPDDFDLDQPVEEDEEQEGVTEAEHSAVAVILEKNVDIAEDVSHPP